MDFKKFWETYTSQRITAISDTVIEVFSKTLSDDISEEYDLGEILTEFTGHHETANNYEKIAEFGKVVKLNNPKLYEEEGRYINKSLIRYYCFRENREKLEEQLNDTLSRKYDFDLLKQSLKRLQYNQHIDLVDKVIVEEFDNVANSPDLLGGAEFDLAIIKYYIEFQRLFEKYLDNPDSFVEELQKTLTPYGFNFDESYAKHVQIGLYDDSVENIKELLSTFPKERSYVNTALEARFLRMMKSKNCPFYISGMVWHTLLRYFEERKSNGWKNYFSFKSSDFVPFLDRQQGFFIDNSHDIALLIWVSSYVLDFLHELKIVPEYRFKEQKGFIQDLKKQFKRENKSNLWEYHFIHKLEKSDYTDLQSWEEEKAEFIESYEIKTPQRTQFNHEFLENETKIDTPKIGRNEKIDVEYTDGTVKSGIKYKKVSRDIETGLCKIITR